MPKEQQIADIDAAIVDAVEKGLDHFGPTFKMVVFHELKSSYNLDSRLIGSKPLIFSEFLDRLFSVGADTIRSAIVLEIGKRFSMPTRQETMISMINKVRRSSSQ